ncbi:hypothetical protein BO70DRAFT_132730 [Aspergillus heteromorphus CBS 117.55]|uniref:Uncharacterized protein n=1 Tax=Aspergillus heteromorphus CBS 117.55 TaxID=1448321 RepID=A0A317WUK0_9EURO|nr:uncharacterized protein BO70DRAFT_132730 [Aspergillus heteromorphus CBS 117.55]PWY90019.1 hypothetical protein BO70DRAFT_132730 [Aspergillus heteromorphus CBS 117.55]
MYLDDESVNDSGVESDADNDNETEPLLVSSANPGYAMSPISSAAAAADRPAEGDSKHITEKNPQDTKLFTMLPATTHTCKSLDYALIKTDDIINRLLLLTPRKNYLPMLETSTMTKMGTIGREDEDVLIVTASTDPIQGRHSATPFFLRLRKDTYTSPFKRVYRVSLDGQIQPGDCGSWVVNPQTGDFLWPCIRWTSPLGYSVHHSCDGFRCGAWLGSRGMGENGCGAIACSGVLSTRISSL